MSSPTISDDNTLTPQLEETQQSESQQSEVGDDMESALNNNGQGAWGDPNFRWHYSPPPIQNSPPPVLPVPRPLVDADSVLLPETWSVLRDLREDFGEAGLTWQGQDGRQSHLDEMDSSAWARVQGKTTKICSPIQLTNLSAVYLCMNVNAPFPTFTGDQVLDRIYEVETQAKRVRDWKDDIARQVAQTELKLQRLKKAAEVADSNEGMCNETRARLALLAEVAYTHLPR